MINPNSYLIQSQSNTQTLTSPQTSDASYSYMMMPTHNPFFAQAFNQSIGGEALNSQQTNPPILMIPPQLQAAQVQFYFPQQTADQNFNMIQQQYISYQQSLQYFYGQLIQNQQQQQQQQQNQMQLAFQIAAQNSSIPYEVSTQIIPFNQQIQFPILNSDQKNLNTQVSQEQTLKLQENAKQFTINSSSSSLLQSSENVDQITKSNQVNHNNKNFAEKMKSSENVSLASLELSKNAKKRTSVASTVSTASNSLNRGEDQTFLNSQKPLKIKSSLNEHYDIDESQKKKLLSAFEPHIQTFLKQMHEQDSALILSQSRRGSNCSTQSSSTICDDKDLQEIFNSNIYLKWAVKANRTCSFANESACSLVSINQKYNNLFKLKKKIKKQLVHKKLTHINSHCSQTTQLSENCVLNQSQENQLQEITTQHQEAQTQILSSQNKQILQKTEYFDTQQNDLQNSIQNPQFQSDDSFDEDIEKPAKQFTVEKCKKQQLTIISEDVVLNNSDFLKQLTLKSNPSSLKEIIAECPCKQQQKSVVKNNQNNDIESICTKCICSQKNQSFSIKQENIERLTQFNIKKELMEANEDLSEIEEENQSIAGNDCNQSKTNINSNQKDQDNQFDSSLSKKVINSKFHNMNKLFMYKLLSSFYLENLEKLGVPFYIREILKKLISLVKLSSKQQSQFQNKQKTDFFSHDHYNLLFLTLNNQTIQYMQESSNNRALHLSCFNFDLSQVQLPLEQSQNPKHILEKIEYINIVKKYACEIVMQSDLVEEKEQNTGNQSSQAILTKQIYTKRALSGIKILNQGVIVRRF